MSEAPKNQPTPEQPKPQGDNLHPALIDHRTIKDVNARKAAEEALERWYDEFEKEVAAVFAKHHIDVFGIGFRHPGAKEYMLITGGPLYESAKAATTLALVMRRQVMKELKMDDSHS